MLKNILVIDSDIENFNEIAANLRDDTTDVQYAATVQIALQKMAAFGLSTLFCTIFIRSFLIYDISLVSYNSKIHAIYDYYTSLHNQTTPV